MEGSGEVRSKTTSALGLGPRKSRRAREEVPGPMCARCRGSSGHIGTSPRIRWICPGLPGHGSSTLWLPKRFPRQHEYDQFSALGPARGWWEDAQSHRTVRPIHRPARDVRRDIWAHLSLDHGSRGSGPFVVYGHLLGPDRDEHSGVRRHHLPNRSGSGVQLSSAPDRRGHADHHPALPLHSACVRTLVGRTGAASGVATAARPE